MFLQIVGNPEAEKEKAMNMLDRTFVIGMVVICSLVCITTTRNLIDSHEVKYHPKPTEPAPFKTDSIDTESLEEHYKYIKQGRLKICGLCH